MILAQITDPHVRPRGRLAYGVIDTEAALRRAVEAVAALVPQPDCVVVTGDLTDCGLAEEYEIVRDCLAALSMPVFVIPGNHDRRENLAAVLRARHPYLPAAGFQHYVRRRLPGSADRARHGRCRARAAARSAPSARPGSPIASPRAADARPSS